MEGFMTDSRNIIIVKKEKKMSKKDQYAAPQNVFHISGNTGDDILAIFEKTVLK
jgi:oxalate decarboxylase/phosphoglucose isomerase-like protein (cupin superfamily)